MGLKLSGINIDNKKEKEKKQKIPPSQNKEEVKAIEELLSKPPVVQALSQKDKTMDKVCIVKNLIQEQNPRIAKLPTLWKLLAEIMVWRIESKKKIKEGNFIQATVNGITIGINVPKELVN